MWATDLVPTPTTDVGYISATGMVSAEVQLVKKPGEVLEKRQMVRGGLSGSQKRKRSLTNFISQVPPGAIESFG